MRATLLLALLASGCFEFDHLVAGASDAGPAASTDMAMAPDPKCSNHLLDSNESDVDCGGPRCGGCALGQTCYGGGDCASGACLNNACIPAAQCKDGTKNGAETDVDCGGGACAPCADGKICVADGDCSGGLCRGGTCASAASMLGKGAPNLAGAMASALAMPAVGDWNGDGKLDLAVTGTSQGAGTVLVWLGVGDGTFTGPAAYASSGGGLAVADLDGDTKLDLVTAQGTNYAVLLGNGDGTFKAQVGGSSLTNAWGVAAGDIDGDTKADVVIADRKGNVWVLLGNGDGTLKAPSANAQGDTPFMVALGDWNGDGKPDIVSSNGGGAALASISLLTGNGTAKLVQGFQQTTLPFGIVATDLDGDGKLDLAAAVRDPADATHGSVSTWIGKGDGTFKVPVSLPAGNAPLGLVRMDVDGDGKADLVTANSHGGDLSVLLGKGDGTFTKDLRLAAPAGADHGWLATGDFNKDGKTDLVDVASGPASVTVYLNTSH